MTEEMYQLLHKILTNRADAHDGRNTDMWIAYESALTMIEYAHDGNYECLSQYDYN